MNRKGRQFGQRRSPVGAPTDEAPEHYELCDKLCTARRTDVLQVHHEYPEKMRWDHAAYPADRSICHDIEHIDQSHLGARMNAVQEYGTFFDPKARGQRYLPELVFDLAMELLLNLN